MNSLFQKNCRIFNVLFILFLTFCNFRAFADDRQSIIDAAWDYANFSWTCDECNTTAWADTFLAYGSAVYDNNWNLIAKAHPDCDWSSGILYQGEAYAYGWDDKFL